MKARAAAAVAAATLVISGLAYANGCGGDEAPCSVAEGRYHIALPEGGGAGAPAVMFLHGLGGSGAGTLRNDGMVDALTARGYAVIAPDGLPYSWGDGYRWYFRPNEDAPRDELAFLKAVHTDAATRFGIDADRVALGGFSNGAFLVAYIACAEPDAFSAYLPVAGGFWRPHPENCAGPVRLFQTQGWTDSTVPIEGRPLRNGTIRQGDIFYTLRLFREASGCDMMRPDSMSATGPFWRRSWTGCDGGALELALHPGGHSVPDGWAAMVVDWLETLP